MSTADVGSWHDIGIWQVCFLVDSGSWHGTQEHTHTVVEPVAHRHVPNLVGHCEVQGVKEAHGHWAASEAVQASFAVDKNRRRFVGASTSPDLRRGLFMDAEVSRANAIYFITNSAAWYANRAARVENRIILVEPRLEWKISSSSPLLTVVKLSHHFDNNIRINLFALRLGLLVGLPVAVTVCRTAVK